jgi:hypothetical protein
MNCLNNDFFYISRMDSESYEKFRLIAKQDAFCHFLAHPSDTFVTFLGGSGRKEYGDSRQIRDTGCHRKPLQDYWSA